MSFPTDLLLYISRFCDLSTYLCLVCTSKIIYSRWRLMHPSKKYFLFHHSGKNGVMMGSNIKYNKNKKDIYVQHIYLTYKDLELEYLKESHGNKRSCTLKQNGKILVSIYTRVYFHFLGK